MLGRSSMDELSSDMRRLTRWAWTYSKNFEEHAHRQDGLIADIRHQLPPPEVAQQRQTMCEKQGSRLADVEDRVRSVNGPRVAEMELKVAALERLVHELNINVGEQKRQCRDSAQQVVAFTQRMVSKSAVLRQSQSRGRRGINHYREGSAGPSDCGSLEPSVE